MSLATRCASCGTVFRVVQDQLKVSEGWVKCGRCGDVFNALEGLFDLERETAPAWTPSQRAALDLLPAGADEGAAQASTQAALAARDETNLNAESETESGEAAIDTRADSQSEVREPESERGELDEDTVGRGEGWDFADAAADDAGSAPDMPALTPAFLRQADSDARWQRPRVRLALALVATLLGLLLAAQVAVWRRDAIAARWPRASPLLALLCEPTGCRIEPLRRLDGLAVESSGLTQLDSPSLYRLQVALRNRDAQALLAPALDVTLTDNRGEVVARKVLSQRDFGAASPTLVAAGAELHLEAVLDSGERRITGYSIEIFYP